MANKRRLPSIGCMSLREESEQRQDLGEAFVKAIAARDFDKLSAMGY